MTRPKPSVEGVETRRAALRILDQVLRSGRTVEAAAATAGGLASADHSLALAIVGETLRRIPEIDALIDSATKRPLPTDSKARMVLRLALAQKLALTIPDHAIVATSLALVDGGPRRLVHGVLGTLLRRELQASQAPPLPEPVEERWRSAWGEQVVEAARRRISVRPPLDLSFKSDEAAQAFAAATGGTSLAPRHVRLRDSGAIAALPGFENGDWWVQDLAASLPARLVPCDCEAVLDACAAPGGKTMQLAAAGKAVTAVDFSPKRLDRLAENLRRTKLAAGLVRADLLDWDPGRQFDSVLLDSPCSATGTFRRHPEVLYRAAPRIIAESAELQARMIERAARWIRPGGALVYSVCSLEPQEGELIASALLAAHPDFTIAPPAPGSLPAFVKPAAEGWVRILPGLLEDQGGLDGFFAACLVRKAD